jgi:hypothetical protein
VVHAGVVVAVVCALGCEESDARPPPSTGCLGADSGCGPYPPGGGGGARDGGRSDAGRSDSGTSNPLAELVGTVVALGADFSTKLPFPGTATIHAEARRGGFVSTGFDGQNAFRLGGIQVAEMTWVGVKPAVANGPTLPTLQALDTRSDEPVELAAIQAEALDFIYQLISLPTTRQTGTGQVIVFFVDDAALDAPVEGLTVHIDGAETVIYDADGTYTDVTTATGNRGVAIVANVPAEPFPGDVHNLAWSGAAAGFQEIRVAADSVSFIGFRVELP